jgi:GTPase SAR1 family protein
MKTANSENLKVLFLGLDGCGKSTIIVKFRDFKVNYFIYFTI